MTQSTKTTTTNWRKLIPTIVIAVAFGFIVLSLAEEIRNWVFSPLLPALDWSRAGENAGAIQAASALMQVVLTLILLVLTWHAIDTSRQVAREAHTQAEHAASRAENQARRSLADSRRQAIASTMPVVTFRDPQAIAGPFRNVKFRLGNAGQGPAINTMLQLSERAYPYTSDRLGEAMTLRVGEEVDVFLTISEFEEFYYGLKTPAYDENGWIPLVRLTTRCRDSRGSIWEHAATLVWDGKSDALRFTDPLFSYPA